LGMMQCWLFLEFGLSAWSPHYAKDKILLEKVQHQFTRLFPELRGLPYEARLEVLQLWTLEARRNRADLIELKYSTADDNLSANDVAN